MLAFVLRRLAQAVFVMLTVGLIAFALFRFVGDPVLFMLGQDATPEQRKKLLELTERYCVVMQTIRSAPPVLVSA